MTVICSISPRGLCQSIWQHLDRSCRRIVRTSSESKQKQKEQKLYKAFSVLFIYAAIVNNKEIFFEKLDMLFIFVFLLALYYAFFASLESLWKGFVPIDWGMIINRTRHSKKVETSYSVWFFFLNRRISKQLEGKNFYPSNLDRTSFKRRFDYFF